MVLLGEAYAFGVIWSFLFNALSMLVLRFKDKREREFKVPVNIRLGEFEIPVGLLFVFCVLGSTAVINLFTKEVATIGGLTFSSLLMVVFFVTEQVTHAATKGTAHEHIEQFTERSSTEVSSESVGSTKPYRKLVAIRSPQNLYMLQRSLDETDPETTDVIVMTAKTTPVGDAAPNFAELDRYDRKLMTAVIELAEKCGKHITPMVVPTNNPLFAVMNTAKSLGVQELVVGASNKFTAEEHLDQMAFYWISLNGGEQVPLTIRVLSRNWDVHYDMAGGNRIPRISERKARTVAELRAAGRRRAARADGSRQHAPLQRPLRRRAHHARSRSCVRPCAAPEPAARQRRLDGPQCQPLSRHRTRTEDRPRSDHPRGEAGSGPRNHAPGPGRGLRPGRA